MRNDKMKKVLRKCFGKEKEERFHAIAMLIISFLFISIVVIVVRINDEQSLEKVPENSLSPTASNIPNIIDELEENIDDTVDLEAEINYSYLYTFTLDQTQEVITGKRFDEKEIFTVVSSNGNQEYVKFNGNYLEKKEGKYHLVDELSPNIMYSNLDLLFEVLEEMIPDVSINQYTYMIPTLELLKAYYKDSTFTAPNTYNSVVITRNNQTIEKIQLDYSNFYSFLQGRSVYYVIEMEFNKVGTTEDFMIHLD